MEHLIQQLSEKQLIYVIERLRAVHFANLITDIPTIKSPVQNINFQNVRSLLIVLSGSDELYSRQITVFANESHHAIKTFSIAKGVRITSIILLQKLINSLQKVQYALEVGTSPIDEDLSIGLLHYTDDELKQQLLHVRVAADENTRKQFAIPTKDVVILTPKPVEFKAVNRLMGMSDPLQIGASNFYYQTGAFEGLSIATRVTGAGNPLAAAETERAIQFFQPKVILLIGMAGGVSKKVRIGDIVVGEQSYYYESGRITDKGFQARLSGSTYSKSLIEVSKQIIFQSKDWQRFTQHKQAYKVKIGTIVAGEKVIHTSKSEIYELIQLHCQDALAVEMEAVGFSTALNAHEQVKGLNIRSISDLLDDKLAANDKGSRELASANAAAFAFELLAHIAIDEY